MLNQNLDEKIRNLKDRIAEHRDYISSDFCTRCFESYQEINRLEKELQDLVQNDNN